MKEPPKIRIDKINKILNKVRPHYKRSNFAVGGMVDYAQDNSQLFNLLEQFYSTNNDSNNTSDESEQLIQQQDLLDDETQEQILDEEVENETSLFGEDFLNGNPIYIEKDKNIYLPDYSDNEEKVKTNFTVPSTGINSNINPLFEEYSKKFGVGNAGIWGDKSHQQRKSDHNTGDAIDLKTNRVRPDIANQLVAEAKERNIKYIIHNNKIWSQEKASQGWRPYKGSNPHTGHIHVSFNRNTNTQTNNMKRKKYLTGGEAAGIGQGVAQLAPAIMSIIDNLSTGYTNQPLVTSKQTVQYNPYSSDFGNKSLPMFAMGGNVPIEAEGDEVIQTPNGQTKEIEGPSHEQGGVDMDVPEGSKIYSDRLQIDGKSMADRKKAREKALQRLQKLSEKSPKDKLLKNSLERTTEVLQMEEAQDMQIQEAAQQIMNPSTERKKFNNGGYAWSSGMSNDIGYWTGSGLTKEQFDEQNGIFTIDPNQQSKSIVPDSVLGQGQAIQLQPNNNEPIASKITQKSATGPTIGDYAGMAGNLFNAFAPLMNTLNNRKGDKPNINAYKNFGKDALEANSQMKDYVAGQRENALTALRQQMNSSKAANRDNARSINTIRALDLATDMGYGKGMNSIYDAFSQQMMGILGQQAQLENQQDQYVMAGEQARDLADRQDRDNFYIQKGQDLANLGNNVQSFGKNLNTMQGNKDMNSLISQLSQFGLGFVRDENGNMVLSKIK